MSRRRLVITVCRREPGVVVLPVERGGPAQRMDAAMVAAEIEALVRRRGLDDRVRLRDACAGGCAGAGPNVDVTIYPVPAPGERPDHVAVGWKSYMYSLGTLRCLADVVDANLTPNGGRRARTPRDR